MQTPLILDLNATEVISRSLRGQGQLVQITVHLGGSVPLTRSCMDFAVQCVLILCPKYFALLLSILHYCMVIEALLHVNYTTSVLNLIINKHLGHT